MVRVPVLQYVTKQMHTLIIVLQHIGCFESLSETFLSVVASQHTDAGMRGLEIEVYMDSENEVDSVDKLHRLNDSITVENSGEGSFRQIEISSWETPVSITANRDMRR